MSMSAAVRRVAPIAGMGLALAASVGWSSGQSARADSTGGCASGLQEVVGVQSALPDGGYAYSYTWEGNTVEEPIPPVGFNPLTATADQLGEYGLPEKPADPVALEQWTADVAGSALPLPEICMGPSNSGSLPVSTDGGCTAAYCSANWSGYIDAPSGNYFKGVEGDYVQPKSDITCTNAELSSWVGLGGWFGSNGLLQTGSTYLRNDNNAFPFWEYLGPKNTGVTEEPYSGTVPDDSGDKIHVSVNITPSSGKVSFYFFNESSGQYISMDPTEDLSKYYDGSYAEWVDERPTDGGLPPLNHYVKNVWTNANGKDQAGDYQSLTSNHQNHIEMWDSGSLLSKPDSPASGSGFTDNFHQCQN